MTNQTWMVTGTSSGFGKEIVLQLAQKTGIQLIATARKESDLDYLDQYDHGQIKKILVDVAKSKEIQRAVQEALAFTEQVDVLVNNAGLGYFSTIEESNMATVRYMFEVNVFGLAEMTKALLPQFRQHRSGTIVNISSALALTTLPTMGFYSATKYAVEGYSDTLRKELAPLGIHVLTVEPSGARTNWAGSSSQKELPQITDYANFQQMVETMDEGVTKSPGNPKLIAKAIIEAVENPDTPDHLPLGNFAYKGSLENLRGLTREIEHHKDISLSTDD